MLGGERRGTFVLFAAILPVVALDDTHPGDFRDIPLHDRAKSGLSERM